MENSLAINTEQFRDYWTAGLKDEPRSGLPEGFALRQTLEEIKASRAASIIFTACILTSLSSRCGIGSERVRLAVVPFLNRSLWLAEGMLSLAGSCQRR
jgi:hypothetical protein